MAKPIKLNGRELSVVKGIGFGLGVSGKELFERMGMPADELCDVLNILLDAGYVETPTMAENISVEDIEKETFEINGSFAKELRELMKK